MEKPKKILFVCVENAGRSQMAEGFLREYAPNLEVASAGTNPKTRLNSVVVEVMKEIGIDITKQKPKKIDEEMILSSVTINMGCVDKTNCPSLFVKDVIDWSIPDPSNKKIEEVRKIRDQVKKEVLNLLKNLESKT